MTELHDNACGGGCPECPMGTASHQHSHQMPNTGGATGWRMVLPAIGVFLGPLALAVLGALLAGPTPARQTAGAFAGLIGGVLLASLAGRIVQRRGKHRACIDRT